MSLVLSVKGGGLLAAKDPSKAGLPDIVAGMLNEDSQNLTAEQISAKLATIGSSIYVTASADETTFTAFTLKKNIDLTLELLQDRLFHPK